MPVGANDPRPRPRPSSCLCIFTGPPGVTPLLLKGAILMVEVTGVSEKLVQVMF